MSIINIWISISIFSTDQDLLLEMLRCHEQSESFLQGFSINQRNNNWPIICRSGEIKDSKNSDLIQSLSQVLFSIKKPTKKQKGHNSKGPANGRYFYHKSCPKLPSPSMYHKSLTLSILKYSEKFRDQLFFYAVTNWILEYFNISAVKTPSELFQNS